MMNIFKKLMARLRLDEAIKQADNAHQKTGHRYYVMPYTEQGRKKLMILDRQNFRRLKQKGYIHHRVLTNDLARECFYHTGHANNTGQLPPEAAKLKRKQFYEWYLGRSRSKSVKKTDKATIPTTTTETTQSLQSNLPKLWEHLIKAYGDKN